MCPEQGFAGAALCGTLLQDPRDTLQVQATPIGVRGHCVWCVTLKSIVFCVCSMRCFFRAAVFAEACLEYGVVEHGQRTTPLLQAIFLEYARDTLALGLHRSFRHYCKLAGDKGQQLLQQYFKHGSSLLTMASEET